MAAFLFGLAAILGKVAYRYGVDIYSLLAVRFTMAAALFWLYLVLVKPTRLVATPTLVLRYLGVGIFAYGASSVLFFGSLGRIDASIAIMLFYAFPAIVIIAERLFYDVPIAGTRLAALLIVLVGLFLLVKAYDPGGIISPLGIVLALGSSLAYATFTLLSARYLAGDREQATTYMITFLAAALLIYRPIWTLFGVRWSAAALLIAGALALFSTFGALSLYFIGLHRLGAAQSSLISTLEPIFTVAVAFIFLGERLDLVQLAGALLVVVGVVLAEIGARRDTGAPSAQT